ncbi:MAG: hypothetical protein UT86_C0001G0043 [Candidatus Magasanikbacteria bacterium GW2011_GWC2_40_17]|uniref:Glycosyltransferase RgtA/B/C/D-like domain-containing protein n=1 Tax=Candidatus Magasanikbacteria bacterium GW2011_GWA2_42_32 TaxID=1619039 RepID=A0A0G1D5R7_9BACT|nr:MAG: hypothetical protein UT86_C0001G0043 [Candidatus Magasanikbacteria bacterium GW2011_GWC2_40_17]KKS57403.1 MAG: hypothetical protein UV20_C0001G0043 [Candidatus Magasanikbacteria bacterium GW2011_GWA2_42_32]
MLILIKLLFFWGVIFLSGWFFVRKFFSEKRIYTLLPLAALFGTVIYLFILNVISYFVSIKISFYLVFAVLFVFDLLIYFLSRKENNLVLGLPKKNFLFLCLVALVIMVSSGLVALRALEYDDLALGHINLSATISEGNFPVKFILNPSSLYAYHYAPDLLTATIYKTTGLPIEFGYDVQIFIFSGLIFLMGFLLIYELTSNFKISLGAAFLMLFGGGLNFFKIFAGLLGLYQKFILHQNVFAPFKFVSSTIDASLVNPVISTIHNHSNAMGVPIFLAIVYLYFYIFKNEKVWLRISLLSGFLFGFLALATETYFAVLGTVFLVYPFFLFLIYRDRGQFKKMIRISGLILLVGLPIAIFQGGIITEYLKNNLIFKLFSFQTNLPSENLLRDVFVGQPFNFFGLFVDMAIPLIIFVPALFYLKQYRKELSFFVLFIVVSFLPPFLIKYNYTSEMKRFWFLTLMFLSLITGWFLSSLIFKFKNENKKKLIWLTSLIFVLSVLGGIIWQSIYIAFPIGSIKKNQPFLGQATQMSSIEKEVDLWIKKNTTLKDNFFAVYEKSKFSFSATEFTALHGRFAPMLVYQESPSPKDWQALIYNQAKSECDSESLKQLQINFVYVTPQWPQGLENKCLQNNKLELVYEIKGEDFIKIYKLK